MLMLSQELVVQVVHANDSALQVEAPSQRRAVGVRVRIDMQGPGGEVRLDISMPNPDLFVGTD